MKAEINSNTLKKTIGYLTVLVDEAVLKIDSSGLSVQRTDPSKVGVVGVELKAEAFEELDVDDEEIAVNLEKIEDIVRMADKDDVVSLDTENETGKMKIQFGGLVYRLALLSSGSIHNDPGVPDLEHNGELEIGMDKIKRGVKAGNMVGNKVTLGMSEDSSFYIEAEGDRDDVKQEFDESEVVEVRENGEALESMFSIDYMKSVTSEIPSKQSVDISLGENHPIRIEHENDEVEVEYMVAPRVEPGK